jgi:hypothetical protein
MIDIPNAFPSNKTPHLKGEGNKGGEGSDEGHRLLDARGTGLVGRDGRVASRGGDGDIGRARCGGDRGLGLGRRRGRSLALSARGDNNGLRSSRGASGMLVLIVEVLVVEAELRRVVDISGIVAGNLETVTVETTRGGDIRRDVPLVVTRVVTGVGDGGVVMAVITTLTVDELKLDLLALESVPLEAVLLTAGHGLTVTRAVDSIALRSLITVGLVVITVVIVLTIVVLGGVVIRVRITLSLAVVAVLGRGRVVRLGVDAVSRVLLRGLVSTGRVVRSVGGILIVVAGLVVVVVVVIVGRVVVVVGWRVDIAAARASWVVASGTTGVVASWATSGARTTSSGAGATSSWARTASSGAGAASAGARATSSRAGTTSSWTSVRIQSTRRRLVFRVDATSTDLSTDGELTSRDSDGVNRDGESSNSNSSAHFVRY